VSSGSPLVLNRRRSSTVPRKSTCCFILNSVSALLGSVITNMSLSRKHQRSTIDQRPCRRKKPCASTWRPALIK
jgi:hypothetical protein